jgi:NADH:ubiquinone oxidoreductase subunit F (NADH-binding)
MVTDLTARPGGAALAPRGLPRLLPAVPGSDPGLGAHLARLGLAPRLSGPAIIAAARAAGLTGRGGAAFPAHRKLAAVAAASQRDAAGRAVVIANGAEGEPGSAKDKTLLWLVPHLVLDGLALAAAATGADRAVLYAPGALAGHLAAVLAERAAAGLDPVGAELVRAPDRFLAGETSAAVSRVSGQPARPRFAVPPVYERGAGGRPTLVQNAETLAHLALIARFGPAWFRAAGTAAEPGSMLCTIQRAAGARHVTEVPLGVSISSLLPGLSGSGGSEGKRSGAGEAAAVQAVLVGGYHGTWLDPARAAGLALSRASLAAAGAAPGAGVLAALPAGRCGLAETARVARYLALESAGQCGPCFNGLPRMAAALADLAEPAPAPAAEAGLRRWAGLVTGRGACHHPDGFARFAASALEVFGAEIARHARGRCQAADRTAFLPVPAPPLTEADWS